MKKHLPIIVGIALPIVFILVLFLVLYIPTLSINPAHNFVYTVGDQYSYSVKYRNVYSVADNKLTTTPQTLPAIDANATSYTFQDVPKLYVYDIVTDSTHEIAQSDAMQLTLVPGPSSPDGYTVSYQYDNRGVFELFGSSGTESGYVIGKGNAKKRLPGLTSSRSYGDDLHIIGWIK